jgi:hypothetical protein
MPDGPLLLPRPDFDWVFLSCGILHTSSSTQPDTFPIWHTHTLKRATVCFSKTPVPAYQTMWYDKTQDLNMNLRCCGNLKLQLTYLFSHSLISVVQFLETGLILSFLGQFPIFPFPLSVAVNNTGKNEVILFFVK